MRCLINRLFSPASLRLTHHRTTKKWISFRQTVIHFFQWRHIATNSLLLWLDLDWIGPAAAAGRFPEEILINRNNELLFFLLLRWEEDVNLASDFWLCFWAEWKWKANKRLPKVSRHSRRLLYSCPEDVPLSISLYFYLFIHWRANYAQICYKSRRWVGQRLISIIENRLLFPSPPFDSTTVYDNEHCWWCICWRRGFSGLCSDGLLVLSSLRSQVSTLWLCLSQFSHNEYVLSPAMPCPGRITNTIF